MSADIFYCYFFLHHSSYPSVSTIAPQKMNEIFCFFDSKCFSFRIWKVEEYRIFAIICAVGRVIVTNFINHWLIVQWWLWGTNSRGSKLKIIFLCYFVRRKNEVCPYFLEHCLVFQYFMITIKKSCPLINLL